jgi:hypothetical protein
MRVLGPRAQPRQLGFTEDLLAGEESVLFVVIQFFLCGVIHRPHPFGIVMKPEQARPTTRAPA